MCRIMRNASEYAETCQKKAAPRNHQAPRGCCYVLLLDLPLHLIQQLIGADGLRGEGVILPPCPDGGSGGQASGHPLLHAGAVDGQHRLACCTQQLIDEGQCQHNSAGDGRGGDGGVLFSVMCAFIMSNPFFSRGWVKRRLSCTIPCRYRCRPSHDRSCRGNSGCAGRRG